MRAMSGEGAGPSPDPLPFWDHDLDAIFPTSDRKKRPMINRNCFSRIERGGVS